MSLTANIALWSVSLTLAVIGITFGIIASYNSNKANQKIRNLIATTWIQNTAQKIFFYELKNLIKENKKIVLLLEENPNITYEIYSINSSHTRFNPILRSTSLAFDDTSYKASVQEYNKFKATSDQSFFKVLPDTGILDTNTKIKAKIKFDLINHHNLTIDLARKIIIKYLNTTAKN